MVQPEVGSAQAPAQVRLALVGTAGAGKDYLYQYLQSRYYVERISFAFDLKFFVGRMLRGVHQERYGTEPPDYPARLGCARWVDQLKSRPAIRALLQAAGEAVCDLYGDDFWCRLALDYLPDEDEDDQPEILIVTDCRKLVEADYCRSLGFTLVRICRTDGASAAGITEATAQHRTETEQAQIPVDYTLYNPGTDAFDQQIEALLRRIAAPAN